MGETITIVDRSITRDDGTLGRVVEFVRGGEQGIGLLERILSSDMASGRDTIVEINVVDSSVVPTGNLFGIEGGSIPDPGPFEQWELECVLSAAGQLRKDF